MTLARFAGRVAILSGATLGIGLATAKRLGQEGCKVVISSRKQKNVDDAVDYLKDEGIEVLGVVSNQRIKEDRHSLIQQTCAVFGGFDCLFINAGASPHINNLLEITEEQFDRTFDTNLKANFQFIQECVPYFVKRGAGSIVTNATAGVYGAIEVLAGKHLLLYTWSKLCLVAMTQHISRDCFDLNIRVNCVAPGGIHTQFLEGGADIPSIKKLFASIGLKEGSPSSRFGEPEEIASTLAYLLSDDASYVTGNCIIPCGGYPFNRVL